MIMLRFNHTQTHNIGALENLQKNNQPTASMIVTKHFIFITMKRGVRLV